MAVPTVVSVTPPEGHSGGRTLVEILGTGFRLPGPPPAAGPAGAPPPTVMVTFGGRAATDVAVYSSSRLYCLTPDQDERRVETPWTASGGRLAAPAHGLAEGTPVRLVASGGRLPAPLAPDVAYYVAGATADDFQLAASPGGVALAVEAGAGRAVSVGAWDVTVTNLDADGSPVPGESATLPAAYTFRRPDFGQEGELARVVRAMLRALKRQVLENTSFATHTDYDADTGDILNLAFVQKLPALVLANLETPDDPEYRQEYATELPGDTGRWVERRPPAVVLVKYDLIGVTDDPVEILNLLQAVRLFFRKNPYLTVDRDASDPSRGSVRYDLEWSSTGPAAVAHQGDNTNVESFSGTVRIRGVLLEDMPGITTAKIPGIPAHYPHEATTRYGHQTRDADSGFVTVDLGKKSEP